MSNIINSIVRDSIVGRADIIAEASIIITQEDREIIANIISGNEIIKSINIGRIDINRNGEINPDQIINEMIASIEQMREIDQINA